MEAELVYIYDGTFEGFLTAIFTVYQQGDHRRLRDIKAEGSPEANQTSLFSSSVPVTTDEELAQRVYRSISQRFGQEVFQRILWVFLSDDPDKEMVIYRYIRLAYDGGGKASGKVLEDMTHPMVRPFDALLTSVANERHKMIQFARFSQTGSGVYYARINPKASVVPLIMDHFAQRFNVQPFLIHDEVHGVVGIYSNQERRWWIASDQDLQVPEKVDDGYESLWQTFYDAICIKQRLNPKLRTGWMPQRLWRNLPELQPKIPTGEQVS